MDLVDPRQAEATKSDDQAGRGKRNKQARRRTEKQGRRGRSVDSLAVRLAEMLAGPVDTWSNTLHARQTSLHWPANCNAERTLLFSAVIEQQADALRRAGLSAQKLQEIFAETHPEDDQDSRANRKEKVDSDFDHVEPTARDWLDTFHEESNSALGIIALCWNLPLHAARAEDGWLGDWLQQLIDRLANRESLSNAEILPCLVIHCELPLLLTRFACDADQAALPEARQAIDRLGDHLRTGLDDPTAWLRHSATYLRAALASVLRCRVLADSLELRKWRSGEQKAISALLKHASRWTRPDGTQLLGAGQNSPGSKAIWSALAEQTRQPTSLTAVMTLAGIGRGKRGEVRKNVSPTKLPALTFHSEESACACMQADWRTKGCRIGIDFSDATLCIEVLGPKGHPVLAGEWLATVEHNGQTEPQVGDWEEVCWFSDDDVDYLELEAQFGEQARVQRQAALFREERILFAADSLLADAEGTWALQSSLPMAAGCEFNPAKKTTEGFLTTPQGERCLTLPLFLPEWRRQLSMLKAPRSLQVKGEDLIAGAEVASNRLFLATCVQLVNAQPKQRFTWRDLTVGEDLRIVQPHEAVAYRIQIGQQQLVVYRSLARPQRRTFLGMHTLAEFYAGRFDAEDGEIDTIVEVETDAAK